ncbi:MAG TPA: heme o synthase [candidate division Zixibacteria bacterium]|nr:heme o synthase [candidate division Zixibacteria bacterium]
MKATVPTSVLVPRTFPLQVADYLSLTKPRVVVLVMICAALGGIAAGGGTIALWLLLHIAIGTGLLSGGAAALNQYFESDVDAQMQRTSARALPQGRIGGGEALAFGITVCVCGAAYLAAFTTVAAAAAGAASAVIYTLCYTPLKRLSAWCVPVGAVAGALPPVIGWLAVTGSLDPGAWAVFAILFTWQLPHFTAIAWLYREDYSGAGLVMIPRGIAEATQYVRRIQGYTLVMVIASLLPWVLRVATTHYAVAAVILGQAFAFTALKSRDDTMDSYARRVFRVSLIYLPAVFVALTLSLQS